MNADELWDWDGDKVKLKAQPKTCRMEFYDNGPTPKHPRTQYGLLLDVDGSKERYNINFEVQSVSDLQAVHDSNFTTNDERATIKAMFDKSLALPGNGYVATSKKNNLSGTGQHDLGYGKGTYCHRIGAVLQLNPGTAPSVYLFIDGTEIELTEGWTAVRNSSHPNKKWQVKF